MDCTIKGCSGNFHSFDGNTKQIEIAKKFNETKGGSVPYFRGQDILMLKDGILEGAVMAKTKVNAIACENDESMPIINLKCTDTFQDVMSLTKTFEVLARCPSPEDCQLFRHEKIREGEKIE